MPCNIRTCEVPVLLATVLMLFMASNAPRLFALNKRRFAEPAGYPMLAFTIDWIIGVQNGGLEPAKHQYETEKRKAEVATVGSVLRQERKTGPVRVPLNPT